MNPGLVQQPDKIVVRFAHTIYPYSLGFFSELYNSIKAVNFISCLAYWFE